MEARDEANATEAQTAGPSRAPGMPEMAPFRIRDAGAEGYVPK